MALTLNWLFCKMQYEVETILVFHALDLKKEGGFFRFLQ